MSAGVTADPNGLSQTAPQYQAVADQLATIYDTLAQAVQTEGACWGSDAVGQTIAAKYTPAADAFWKQAGYAATDGLPTLANAITTWSQAYTDMSESELAAATQFRDSLG